MIRFILSVILAGIVIFAITICLLFIGKEIADFLLGKGHYKEGGKQ